MEHMKLRFKLDNLQLFGGSGNSSSGGSLTKGKGVKVTVKETTSLMSERETKQQEVDEVMTAFMNASNEYGSQINDIQVATLGGRDGASTMAYYEPATDNIAINASYFNSKGMDKAYDASIKSGWHPSRGTKSGLEATASHEIGHQLVAKTGQGANTIVKQAMKITKTKSSMDFASKISGYAKQSWDECIAEAMADCYCNGSKAKAESKAIKSVMNSYLKGGK